jgi:flagellar biosynthesis protein FlgN
MVHHSAISPELSHHFAQSLAQSVHLLQQLEATMLEEAEALAHRNPDVVHQVVQRKAALVIELETVTKQQKQWVETAQLPFNPAGLATFLVACSAEFGVYEQWAQVRTIGRRCDQLNRANARLIEQDRKRVASLLRILKGDDATSATYTPQGRAKSVNSRSRTLSHA